MLLALALAALEAHHGRAQALIGGLAGEVAGLGAELDLHVDFERREERKAFADALDLLCRLGVLRQRDGSREAFVARDEALEEALFDIEHGRLGDLKATSARPHRCRARRGARWPRTIPPTEDGERARRRHRIARTLVEEPVLYVHELEPAEQDSYRSQRHRLEPELEALTGLQAERRAEGSALVAACRRRGPPPDRRALPHSLDREPARAACLRAAARRSPTRRPQSAAAPARSTR